MGLNNVTILLLWKIKQFFQVYKLWSAPDIDFLLFRGGGRVVSDVQDGLGFGWDYMRGWFQMPQQQEREDAWGLPLPPAAQAAPASGEHHQCRGPGLRKQRKKSKRFIKSFRWLWQGSFCYDALKANKPNGTLSGCPFLFSTQTRLIHCFHFICLFTPMSLVCQRWLHSTTAHCQGFICSPLWE